MNRNLYRELWQLRFEKMLSLEQKAVLDYKKLLDETRASAQGHVVESHLEKMITDEAKHVGLVKELLAILARQA